MRYRYIEQIWDNVREVDKDQLYTLYELMSDSECIIPYGSGRSYSALKIPMSQYAKMPDAPIITTPEDTGFPGNNMYEALNILSKRYKKILLLINSGSGASEEPLAIAKDFEKFIVDHKMDGFKIAAITSNLESPIGKLATKYGVAIQLKGRRDERVADFLTAGIMGDNFELGSMMLVQALVNAIHKGSKNKIYDILEGYYKKIVKIISEYVDSDLYNNMIDILSRRSNVYIGGRGSAHEVATMLVIRLNHIKYAVGDHVYRARGSNTPRPRPGDLGILISCSGENPSVNRWARNLISTRAYVVAIVGVKNSSLARLVHDNMVVNTEEIKPGTPRDFYMYASFLLSPLPIRLIEKFKELGLVLPESLLKYYHSTVE
jgi:D-arabinose 5-phosphate isomerase GutQ